MEVKIKFTYQYSFELLQAYYHLLNCEYVGRHTRPVSYQEAELKLKQLLQDRFLDSTQMAVMEIYADGKLVGMSLPRHTYTEQEKEVFNIDNSYYRFGKLVILPEFRSKGIAYEACRLFMKCYPKIIYQVDTKNEYSTNLVVKLGIPYSHTIVKNDITYLIYKN